MENNGRGIFYGVIGVATLVIAIIGATFAFFAASQTGNSITAEAAQVGLKFEDSGSDYMKTKLIPVETGFNDTGVNEAGQTVTQALEETVARKAFAESEYVDATKCVDKNGYEICSMYQFSIENEGNANMPINISFTTSNTIQNLKFAVFEGSATAIENFDVRDTANVKTATAAMTDATTVGELIIPATDIPVTTESNPTASASFGKYLDVTLGGVGGQIPTKIVYTVVVWIEEIGVKQDASGKFEAQVNVVTGNGEGITGTLA